MKIQHEAPAPEVDWKVSAALFVETPQRETIRIDSWSLSGLEWPEGAPPCPNAGTLTVPFQGMDIRFPVRLEEQDGEKLVKLVGLSGRQRETLALFYRSLLSGRMASSGDVITSLDTPLDLVPMGETEAEKAISSKKKPVPRLLRAFINVVTYVLLAAAVVGVVGSNIFTNVDRIDIQHGRVLAPTVQMYPPRSGLVESMEAAPGQVVSQGDILIRINDPALQARLHQTEADLSVAQAAHERLVRALQELARHRNSENLAQRMAVTSRLYSRFLGNGGFEEIRKQWIALRGRGSEIAARNDPLKIVFDMLSAEAEQSAAQVTALNAARDGHLEMMHANHLVATSDGMVQDISVQPGQLIGPKDTVLDFESSGPRVTMGWVSERFAETIYIGMPATIGLNEKGKKITMAGVVTDVRAGHHPERPGEFGIIVVITATSLSPEATKTRLRVGAPVNLEAKRQLARRLTDWATRLIWNND